MPPSCPTPVRSPRLTITVTKTHHVDGPPSERPIDTPSSITVEYGDSAVESNLSAVERAGSILNRPSSTTKSNDVLLPSNLNPPTQQQQQQQQQQHRDRAGIRLFNDRLTRFLSSLAHATTTSPDPHDSNMNPSVSQEMEDLLHRNRALQRRIASIKRSEEHLAKDNRSLSALVKMLRDEKVPLQARIKALERRIVDLNQRLFRAQRPTPSPSGTTITTTTAQSETVGNGVVGFDGSTLFLSRNTKLLTTFFAAHGPIWSNWVDTYGHSSPLRLSSLHPSQIREITSAVAPFVKLSEPEQKLPQSLVRPAGVASTRHINPARMLLRGMLAHFIVEEVLGEVFWGVDALGGKGAVETEVQGSCVPGDGSGGRGYEVVDERKDKGRDKEGEDKKGEGEGERKGYGQGGKRGHGKNVDENENLKSGSGIKLRFDAHDLSRAPSAGLPATARSLCVLSPGGRDWPAILPLGAGLAGVAEVLPAKVTPVPPKVMAMQYNLPGKEQMGDLMVLLQRTQGDAAASAWRASLMQQLAAAGLASPASESAAASSASEHEDRQMVINARIEYARSLAERFLCSPARYLLDETDAAGISRLEESLVAELDAALRFSVQMWAQNYTPVFYTLKDLELAGRPREDTAELFLSLEGQTSTSTWNSEQVVMVLQPAVGIKSLSRSGDGVKIWVKAQVAVASGSGSGSRSGPGSGGGVGVSKVERSATVDKKQHGGRSVSRKSL